ncbi:pentapeptide repeat-containing protein [Actinomadura spongiicola]|uniref:Pentapeptide repeat-containing protein n=1 Tax=Actinomadura spongiicola TaxID=2303421 RepID=A0A372GKQ6_9ACTN|nr:pentapeptide repeat-containing protein [Actinomadura spongiicola]RFS85960.1 pentapeptide repeat-containing protein [Actinomadura spongiicola]
MMERLVSWKVVLAALGLVLLLLAIVLFVPRMAYPPLSATELQGVSAADKRIELQHARGQLQGAFRGQLLQALAGLFIIAGSVAAWQQVRVARDGQITERFTRAIEHLGDENRGIRIGGLYALERIANNSPSDRATIQRTIGAFVRNNAAWPVGAPDGPEHPTPDVDESIPWLQIRAFDIQTAVAILGRRPPSKEQPVLHLSRCDLRSAGLAGATLPSTQMRHANLARAQMDGCLLENSNLYDTDLRGASLRGAHMANVILRNAYLQGANLSRADLRGADLRGANMEGAVLAGTNLSGAVHDATTTWPSNYTPQPTP